MLPPMLQRSELQFEAPVQLAWAAKACVRLGYILRSRGCTPSSLDRNQGACAWRTAEQPNGDADSLLAEAGVAAAEALIRLGACLATSGVVPPAIEAANWEALPSKVSNCCWLGSCTMLGALQGHGWGHGWAPDMHGGPCWSALNKQRSLLATPVLHQSTQSFTLCAGLPSWRPSIMRSICWSRRCGPCAWAAWYQLPHWR